MLLDIMELMPTIRDRCFDHVLLHFMEEGISDNLVQNFKSMVKLFVSIYGEKFLKAATIIVPPTYKESSEKMNQIKASFSDVLQTPPIASYEEEFLIPVKPLSCQVKLFSLISFTNLSNFYPKVID